MKLAPLLLLAAALSAQTTVIDLIEAKTRAELAVFDSTFDGALGVAVIDLTTGRRFSLHGGVQFTQASEIKIPILIRMYQADREGALRLDAPITLTAKDAVGGSGHLQAQLKTAPVTLTVRELIDRMIADSDNTATNKCIDLGGGMARINRMLDQLGFPKTRLLRKMMDSAAALRNDENISTPDELARMVEMLYHHKLVDPKACDEMIGFMKKVHGGLGEGLPLDIETAAKTGQVPGARCETGIVFLPYRPFVISIQSSFLDDRRTPVPEVTRIVYRYFEKLARSNLYGHTIR